VNTAAADEVAGGPAPPDRTWVLSGLADVLHREAKLLMDLREVLERQRRGVAEDDLALVDETVYSAQRIFRTLAEARRRRQALLELLTGDRNARLRDLEGGSAAPLPPEILLARDALHSAARLLAGELEVNRRVLQGALESGEELIRSLRGGGPRTPGYGPDTGGSSGPGDAGRLIDRQV